MKITIAIFLTLLFVGWIGLGPVAAKDPSLSHIVFVVK
jgi:hypothetical protein